MRTSVSKVQLKVVLFVTGIVHINMSVGVLENVSYFSSQLH
jgi:hypothetical protein